MCKETRKPGQSRTESDIAVTKATKPGGRRMAMLRISDIRGLLDHEVRAAQEVGVCKRPAMGPPPGISQCNMIPNT